MLAAFFAIIIFAVAADITTKILTFGKTMAFIPGFIRFESVRNEGMVWGMMNGVNGFVAVISVVTALVTAILLAVFFKYHGKMSKGIQIGLAMIIGGAIGNLIDRVSLGFVRDFICTEFINFPVFNVADIFVTCGAILLGILLVFTKNGHELFAAIFPDEKKAEKAAEAAAKAAEENAKEISD